MNATRCDLHLHSAASIGNDEWYTRFFGCPESYAEPVEQYELCKTRGMSLVTLTDHDTIAGGLKLLDRPDFFLSEEVTATFPENGCIMHVLAWNITPAQHDEIQARRRDIYRLCEYLNSAGIANGLAHPLLSPNWKLDADIVEKVLLLFPALEGVNGMTDRRIEPDLSVILERLTPGVIAALAAKHGLPAFGKTPHKKALTAGSDDHVRRRSGTVYTEIDGVGLAPTAFVARCMAGEGRLVGRQAHIDTMAMSVKHTTYHHLKQRQDENGYRNPFVDMIDLIAGRDPETATAKAGNSGSTDGGTASGFVATLCAGAARAAVPPGKPYDLLEVPAELTEADDARVIRAVGRLADKVLEGALGDLLAGAQDFDLYRIFGALRDMAGGLVTAAPMFFAADHFGKQEQAVRRLWKQWTAFELPPRPERLGVFTDSLAQVDGVSTWCKRFLGRARAEGRDVVVPYCGDLPAHVEDRAGFEAVPSVTSFTLPIYSGIKFHVPSLVETLQWTWRAGVSHVELATPGPMGLVGLLVAKVLRLPVTASYHTEVPALIQPLGGNLMMERAARRYLAWFYGRVDRVFAFSAGSRDALVDIGVAAEKVEVMPVAVDPDDFSPAHRSPRVFEVLDLDVGDRPVILSVGRVSEEKNLPVMIDAVERLQDRRPAPVLVLVGDGPERSCLEQRCRGKSFVRFAGLQAGEILKQIYASARVFIFASRVDTLGLVNMEAMASGLPVLVPDDACIAEFVTHGLSAECYPFGAAGLATAIAGVLDDPSRAARLGAGGRQAMIERWNEASFSRIWKSLTQQT
ncbi:MAG TPA: glycosyltransferase [Polyangia bacterium]|jgi:glycosyltransferase involved in cell wall biosynthesis